MLVRCWLVAGWLLLGFFLLNASCGKRSAKDSGWMLVGCWLVAGVCGPSSSGLIPHSCLESVSVCVCVFVAAAISNVAFNCDVTMYAHCCACGVVLDIVILFDVTRLFVERICVHMHLFLQLRII